MINARFEWVTKPDGKVYSEYIQQVKAAMLHRALLFAAEMRRSAQLNRRWTDRTGHARARLMAKAHWQGSVLVFHLFHQMFYGVFLELRWGGRYAILMHTLNHFFNRILRALHAIWTGGAA